jgi:hypothetical protein
MLKAIFKKGKLTKNVESHGKSALTLTQNDICSTKKAIVGKCAKNVFKKYFFSIFEGRLFNQFKPKKAVHKLPYRLRVNFKGCLINNDVEKMNKIRTLTTRGQCYKTLAVMFPW